MSTYTFLCNKPLTKKEFLSLPDVATRPIHVELGHALRSDRYGRDMPDYQLAHIYLGIRCNHHFIKSLLKKDKEEYCDFAKRVENEVNRLYKWKTNLLNKGK